MLLARDFYEVETKMNPRFRDGVNVPRSRMSRFGRLQEWVACSLFLLEFCVEFDQGTSGFAGDDCRS